MRLKLVGLCVGFMLVVGCTTSGGSAIVAASFNSVLGAQGDAITRTRPDAPSASWSSFAHEDLSDSQCYDLVVAPDGVNRFMFFVDRLNDTAQRLYVRSGLGNSVWSSVDAYIDVPALEGFCASPRSVHIGNNRYVVVWLNGGDLHTALYDNSQSPGFQLTLGDVLPGQYTDVSITNLSLVFVAGEPRVYWASADRQRISMRRGKVLSDTVRFDSASRYFDIETTSNSDAIVDGDKVMIAVSDSTSVQLLASTNSLALLESVKQCPYTNEVHIAANLLYKTVDGGHRALVKNPRIFNSSPRMLDFESCSSDAFPLQIRYGRITHHRNQ